ncbi:MAG: Lipoprotein-releasing system ATP-binding protein LolD [Candidatus Moanabacter tarae]|uniref:Lipoprotein-releasing system ATP-binding protein LolD n=1 Tax=Candidatus Moanibacter tarae TaxID=2200854 RepID=A0A2Z4AIH1_9BACT|nr:MAG: Lipoprotein-releasing system ATP-binding protein LolD [Candidatus Moanabacter tarae]|tara:strand:- start:105630 stop:106334 length:705 start_codon:yes stop_codon:yes gene_type:complete
MKSQPKANVSSEIVLTCSDIKHSLGEKSNRVPILKNVGFTLNASKVHAIVGPSGCGKSTLLYLAGLLDRPDSGEICLRGDPMANASDEQRTKARNEYIGFVFQFHFLLAEFSVLENVMLPMRKQNTLNPEEMKDRAFSLLVDVALDDKADRLATQLSGGEQQRVAIARALANSPSLILADEPTGNLDVANSSSVFDLLYRFAAEKGHAVLIVTHNMALANRCDNIFRMEDGCFI